MNNDPIRILHVVTSLEDGGLEKIVYLIVSNLSDKRFKHYIATLVNNKNSFLSEDFKNENVQIVNYDFDNRFKGLNTLFKNISQTSRLAKYIKHNKIQIVHSHDFFPAFTARVAGIFSMIFYFYRVNKIFITLHNSFIWLKPAHHFVNKLLSLFTTRIICVSRSVLEFSLKYDKIDKKKYILIYNGVNIDNYTPNPMIVESYKKEFDIDHDDIIIGNVGVLSVRKGQKYLIEAFRRLLDGRSNLTLLIFGSERSHEKEIANELKILIHRYDLKDKVKIIAPRKDLNLIYNIFDIYVMTSLTEGLSLSAIEAMLMKRICLFSDIPSFKEMIKNGENGFLFKSEDSQDLTLRIEEILDNITALNFIGENARLNALNKFNLKKMSAEYETLYLG